MEPKEQPDKYYREATLKDGEYHPAADGAMAWLKGFMVQHLKEYAVIKESLASTALSGNRQAELCMSTIMRMAKGEPVSDRYLLGLAWTVMTIWKSQEVTKTKSYRVDV